MSQSVPDGPVVSNGDAAVTGFSGTKTVGTPAPGSHPLDATILGADAPVLQVFDLSQLGGPAAGQLVKAPVKLKVKAGDIGQVFGVTLDEGDLGLFKDDRDAEAARPNIYVAATSMYGLQISKSDAQGNFRRLVRGERGARWAEGQFGTRRGGGPGTIWRIDGTTSDVSLFADIRNGGLRNSGPGLGALAYDGKTRQIFVSDLESGLIHRLDLEGTTLEEFDHGLTGRPRSGLPAIAYDPARRLNIESPDFNIEKPATWGFVDKKRLVFGLAVQSGRLYYATAEPLEVWSVGINADGSFAPDAKRELSIEGTPAGNVVTSITFDGPGKMYLTQRGDLTGSYAYTMFARPQASVVLRYEWNEQEVAWKLLPDEFPIALEPPHRATNGGVALGYGYKPDGTIDLSQCRETVWSTGEHLREGQDKARVEAGGPRIVNGLQGMPKSAARPWTTAVRASGTTALDNKGARSSDPGNDPPWTSWFIDNDGTYNHPDFAGHIGSMAIPAHCGGKVASGYDDIWFDPDYELRLSPRDGVSISKTCAPAMVGGKVSCAITVTNRGTRPSRTIRISDAAAILNGPNVGAQVQLTSLAPDGPEWTCTSLPARRVSCGLPAGVLLPGQSRSISVQINTGTLVASGDQGFRNCARLGYPYRGRACATWTGTEINVAKTGPLSCAAGGTCAFTLIIANNGKQPYSGNVLLSDNATGTNGASVPMTIASVTPPLGCAKAPTTTPFSCVAPVSLAPGQTQTHQITVNVPPLPAGAPGYFMTNCFALADASLATGAQGPWAAGTAGPTGAAGNPACYFLPITPPVPGPQVSTPPVPQPVPVPGPGPSPPPSQPTANLRLTKTAQSCVINASNQRLCKFSIAVTNDGTTPYVGPIAITDDVAKGSGISKYELAIWPGSDPRLNALNPATNGALAITSSSDITLQPGTSITTEVVVSLDAIDGQALAPGCQLPNSALLLTPAIQGAGATASATAQLPKIAAPDGKVTCGPEPVQSAPPPPPQPPPLVKNQSNLKITKAVGACNYAGGWICPFTVSVQNMGPAPYSGPLVIRDTVPDEPGAPMEAVGALGSVSPAVDAKFTLDRSASSNELLLTSKETISLAPGQSINLDMTMRIESWRFAKLGSACSLSNTATLVSPASGIPTNSNGSDDTATASAQLPKIVAADGKVTCGPEPDQTTTPPPPQPPPLMKPSSNLKITKTSDGCAQVQGGPPNTDWKCSFKIVVANEGLGVYSGPLVIDDGIYAGGVSATPQLPDVDQMFTSSPDLGGNSIAGLKLTSKTNVTIDPGKVVAVPVDVWVNSWEARPTCEILNRAWLVSPQGGEASATATLPKVELNWARQYCGTLPANLALRKKTIKFPGESVSCKHIKKGFAKNDFVACQFQVDLVNLGPGEFKGPVVLDETIPAYANLYFSDPNKVTVPLTGKPGETKTVELKRWDDLRLAPGNSISLNVGLAINTEVAAKDGCKVLNKASIASGSPVNTLKVDDKSLAYADVHVKTVNKDGISVTTCDPTNLALTKTLVEPCTAANDNYRCAYKITVTNTGPDPYEGPLSIAEDLGGNPTSVSFSEGWTCSGTGSSRTCDKPTLVLDPPKPPLPGSPGALTPPSGVKSVDLIVTASYPKTAACSVPNTATLVVPTAGEPGNGDARDDAGDVVAALPNPECEKSRAQCTPGPGEVLTSSGECACRSEFVRGTNGTCGPPDVFVETEPETPKLTGPAPKLSITKSAVGACKPSSSGEEGYECAYTIEVANESKTAYNGPVRISETFSRAPGWLQTPASSGWACTGQAADWECSRAAGLPAYGTSSFTVSGLFPIIDPKDCAVTNTATITSPAAPVGSEPPSAKATTPATCGSPVLTPAPLAKCPDGAPIPQSGVCPCTGGASWNAATKSCEAACQPGPNETRTASGVCVCNAGYERVDGSVCLKKKDGEACQLGPNELRDASGNCVCRVGTVRSPQGACIPGDATTTRPPIEDDNPREPSPAVLCERKGGDWNGRKCVFEEKKVIKKGPSQQEKCLDNGGKWKSGSCVYPEKVTPKKREKTEEEFKVTPNDVGKALEAGKMIYDMLKKDKGDGGSQQQIDTPKPTPAPPPKPTPAPGPKLEDDSLIPR